MELSDHQRQGIKSLLQPGLDWPKLLELAAWHRVSAILQLHLGQPDLAALVPDAAQRQLQAICRDNAARGLYLRASLRRVLDTLHAADIPVVVLKGAALAETVYDDPALRPMGDLDIMVPEPDLTRTDELMRGLGYAPYVSTEIQAELREHHHHYPALKSPDGVIKLEIHRHVIKRESSLYFDLAGFWRRAITQSIAGTDALVLAPEDLLLHLCLNFFQDRQDHSNGALSQVVDVAEVLRCYAAVLDWDRFVTEVRRHQLAGPVFCALLTARNLLDAPVPDAVRAALEPGDFDPTTAALFINRRVLDSEPWLAHRLVDSRAEYTWRNLMRGALRRFTTGDSSTADLAEKYGNRGGSRWAYWLYLRQFGEKAGLLGRVMLRPRELRDDLQLDRWLHSLQ